jgi:hypothetical protein
MASNIVGQRGKQHNRQTQNDRNPTRTHFDIHLYRLYAEGHEFQLSALLRMRGPYASIIARSHFLKILRFPQSASVCAIMNISVRPCDRAVSA